MSNGTRSSDNNNVQNGGSSKDGNFKYITLDTN